MRVLSQIGLDGGISDVPYEKCGFYLFYDEILAGHYVIQAELIGGQMYKMAEYSTKAKAKRSIDMLHEKWSYSVESGLFQFPQDSEIETMN